MDACVALRRTPSAGEYAMSLTMSFSALITMEMVVSAHRQGAMRLTLAPDGTAHALLGVRSRDVVNGQPRYQPAEKREYRESDDARLLAHVGKWSIVDGVAVIDFDRTAWNSWDLSKATSPATTQLRCIALDATARIPAASLACEMSAQSNLLDLGMPMSRNPAPRPQDAAPVGRNLVLAAPGIDVTVEQDRRAAGPTFKFKAAAVQLVEASYQRVEAKPKPKR